MRRRVAGSSPPARAPSTGWASTTRRAGACGRRCGRLDDLASPEAAGLRIELAFDALYGLDLTLSRSLAAEALAAAGRIPDAGLAATAGALLALAGAAAGVVAEAEPQLDAALARVEALAPEQLARRLEALWYLAWAETFLERYEAAVAHSRQALEISRSTGQERLVVPLMLAAVFPLQMLGRMRESSEIAAAAVEAARLARQPPLAALGALGARRGRRLPRRSGRRPHGGARERRARPRGRRERALGVRAGLGRRRRDGVGRPAGGGHGADARGVRRSGAAEGRRAGALHRLRGPRRDIARPRRLRRRRRLRDHGPSATPPSSGSRTQTRSRGGRAPRSCSRAATPAQPSRSRASRSRTPSGRTLPVEVERGRAAARPRARRRGRARSRGPTSSARPRRTSASTAPGCTATAPAAPCASSASACGARRRSTRPARRR